jgi:hypothetical protein
MNGGRVDGLTDIETPHVLKAPPIIEASKYLHHVVRESNCVRAKTVVRERRPSKLNNSRAASRFVDTIKS